MDLRQWIVNEHASVATRFDRSVADVVPMERWREAAGAGGSSIAHLLFHTAHHADLAMNCVVRGDGPLLPQWRDRLGIPATPDGPGAADAAGLPEAEDPALTAALDLGALTDYSAAVHAATADWLATAAAAELDRVPDSAAALEQAGVGASDVPWLHSMWADQPVSFFVQWEAIGHRLNHLGEMVSVRNRLGLSPF
jgi:hypothetical protein